MNSPRLFLALAFLLVLPLPRAALGEDLSSENIDSIRLKLEKLQESLENHLSTRNSSAGAKFAAAAADPKAAAQLYLDCHRVVDFEREGRPNSDYRAWEDGQSDRLRDEAFLESLLLQLRYLALSCEAAEAEDPSAVFNELMAYADSLGRMEEMPTSAMTGSVAGSVFAKAFYLEELLGGNDNWEPVPFNIGGIYERTILPHLRSENPSAIPNAWDKRIEQQTRLVEMIEEHKEAELRGLNRDQERRARTNQERRGGIMKDLDRDDFVMRVLPRLKWGKMKDVFLHVSEVQGAQAMLPFVEEHLTHELGKEFYREFLALIEQAEIGSDQFPSDSPPAN